MGYVYTAMWLIIGLMLVFRYGRENRVFYFAGGFFLFMGIWWLIDTLTDLNLFADPWVWVFRGAVAVALAILIFCFLRERKKNRQQDEKSGDKAK